MHCLSRFVVALSILVGILAACGALSPTTARADDLEQSLKSAVEDGDTSSEKPKEESDAKTKSADAKAKDEAPKGEEAETKTEAKAAAEPKPKPKYPPFEELLKDKQTKEGLFTLHRKDDHIYAELKPEQFNRDYIVLIAIARGIGQAPILGGFTWQFGDDWVWQFRKAGERIHLVRRNVRFRADKNSPNERALQFAYTDSILFSLPISTKTSSGNYVVDLTSVFLSDLPQISQVLPGFSFSPDRSTWAAWEGFPKNVELEVAATYSSSGAMDLDTVPDSRGATVNIHYSISELPQTSYKPRIADDRIGYFLSVTKDYSKKDIDEDRFVRYITRWNLEKSDPAADISPPKEPIVFWLEKTIPFQYRKPIRDGILEWNKAFEKAGYYDAIEVRQQPDDATWDPGDVRYNTFRWITAGVAFAMGPSRVNPTTGQILDADIILDADYLQYVQQYYETFTPEGVAALTGGPIDIEEYRAAQAKIPPFLRQSHNSSRCSLLDGMSRQLAMGAIVIQGRKRSPEDLQKMLNQAVKEVAMHEVGHTLGLRHNFKASSYYSLADANDVSKTSKTGVGASVMDYNPVNIVPSDATQGDYFSTTIGPYDMWAIEYGYKPLGASSPEAELPELKKIAARNGESGLAFATDEDIRNIDPDPHSRQFDLGDDLVEYAQSQAKVVNEAMPSIVDQMTKEGEGYQLARRAFGVLMARYGEAMFSASRYVGGLYVSRGHKGDANSPEPLVLVPVDKQRAALTLVEENVLNDKPFNFSPELYNHLAASHWDHWGVDLVDRTDYPAHQIILMWQDRILARLMSSLTLTRVHDSELKTPSDQDAITTSELLTRLTKAVYSEVDNLKEGEYTDRKPAVSSLRRNLQRAYLKRLSQLALGQTQSPEDCETIAFVELTGLKKRLDSALDGNVKLDNYTKAHFEESSAKIAKVLDSKVLSAP